MKAQEENSPGKLTTVNEAAIEQSANQDAFAELADLNDKKEVTD